MPINTNNIQVVISAVDKASAVFKNMNAKMSNMGKNMTALGKDMSLKMTAPIVAMGVISVKSAADFDQAMTKSIAIMKVTIEQEKQMRDVARSVAKSTVFSHKEAGDAYFYLASAGLGANEAMAAMPAVAEFAQAGMFDMALATDLLTDAQSALGLTIKDDAIKNMENMVKVSDTLVKANTLANATVEQFSSALTTEAGAALKSFNIDIEEGVAVLAAFADQGVKGQVAGSGLSRILRLMTTAATKNKEEMDALGITVFDTEGNIRNIADIINDLEDAFKGMSDEQRVVALESIGFSARVQGIILPLLGTSGAIRQYEKDLRIAGGTTKEVADKQLKSFTNQMLVLKNQLVDVGITIGTALMPHIIKLAEFIKNLVTKFQGLSPEMQKVILVVVGLLAALGPVLMILGSIALALPLLGVAFTLVMGPIGLVVLAIAGLIAAGIYLYKNWDSVSTMFQEIWEGINKIFINSIDGIKGKLTEFIEWFMSKIGWVVEKIEGVKSKISGIGEKVKGGIKGVLGFQEGGIVPGIIGAPVPAIVHGGETIIPVGQSVGNTFNFNFAGAFIGNKEEFEKEVIELINRESELKAVSGE